ncbi:hypothetical protein A3A93_01960 [Candidatus Roizmanbacteria bacterium RIFCSPLOWO2_01_FULL_38_12]|uniref:dTDP-4-dehydrorhamnose reductase n=1 Tax=Candidatus Roizmanbacteria bacterium RIFCSPLOWO2_01_FULL_38_12 TaxID=1802061 RepID=A0A1F7IY11_9BACT|nr:MAG: hypothetical protein A3A93_01960 [Candidatus Roizmanbacteria bacterium RIFCSPLOWO2_01_FULL_38_12]
MLKIAITGPDGLIGSRIIELLKNAFHILSISHNDLDITDKNQVSDKINALDFDFLLHLAGYTSVDGAEKEKNLAYKINVEGTKHIFEAVENRNKKMIYISTDFVFDGKNPPFFEDSVPNPLGYYGLTKYEGEKIVKDKAMIVRISYPYGNPTSQKPDFVTRLKQLLEKGQELKMMQDASITPTLIDDITKALKYLITNYKPEVYHIVGSQSLSPFEAGMLIAKKFNMNEDLIKPISFAKYETGKAPRPQFSEIKSKKNDFQEMRGFVVKT